VVVVVVGIPYRIQFFKNGFIFFAPDTIFAASKRNGLENSLRFKFDLEILLLLKSKIFNS